MKAFYQNIDALEQQMIQLVQKWKDVRVHNIALIEQNKQLEKEIQANKSETNVDITESSQDKDSNVSNDLSQIKKALEQLILRIDGCIELISKEMDGKR